MAEHSLTPLMEPMAIKTLSVGEPITCPRAACPESGVAELLHGEGGGGGELHASGQP